MHPEAADVHALADDTIVSLVRPATAVSRMYSQLSIRPSVTIFVVAFLVRVAWVVTLENDLKWIDERSYADIALHLAAGDGYVSNSFRANPILPFYLSGFFRVFGENYLPPRIVQSVLGAATCTVIYAIATSLFRRSVGILAGLLLAVYLPQVYLSGVFYGGCLLTFLVSLVVLLTLAIPSSRRRVLWALACGACVGLAILTRGVAIVFVPVVFIAWAYMHQFQWRSYLASCAAVSVGIVFVVAPWTMRNVQLYGRPILVNSGLHFVLWKAYNELSRGDADDRHLLWTHAIWEDRLAGIDPSLRRQILVKYERIGSDVSHRYAETGDLYLAYDDVLRPVAREQIRSNPLRSLQLIARRVVTLYTANTPTYQQHADTSRNKRVLAAISFYPILVLALLGAVLAARRWRIVAVLYLTIAALTAAYGVLTACTRFRLPLDPLLIIFAAYAVSTLAERAYAGQRFRKFYRVISGPEHADGSQY